MKKNKREKMIKVVSLVIAGTMILSALVSVIAVFM